MTEQQIDIAALYTDTVSKHVPWSVRDKTVFSTHNSTSAISHMSLDSLLGRKVIEVASV